MEWPAASTVGEILKREGLIIPRRRLPSYRPIFRPGSSVPSQPNDRWTMDFKGHFRLLDGTLCYPLTLRDAFSRMVLRIDACLRETCEVVLPLLEAAFREHGMPLELHSDTGAPFGSTGLGRLSVISVFLLKLGIRPLFSRPGKPQDNGAHERMHLDLKAETTRPPGGHMAQQQQMFDEFRECFDFERPHHALGGSTPSSNWADSPRQFPATLESPTYAGHWETRWVDSSGYIKWNDERIFVGSALRHEPVGIEPFDEGLWRLHFATLHIGMLQMAVGRTKKTVIIGR
jgi:transposase InsO family protein